MSATRPDFYLAVSTAPAEAGMAVPVWSANGHQFHNAGPAMSESAADAVARALGQALQDDGHTVEHVDDPYARPKPTPTGEGA